MLHSFPFVLKYKYKYKASYERNFCRKEIEKKEMLSTIYLHDFLTRSESIFT